MDIVLLTPDRLSDALFAQLSAIEQNSGLDPWPDEILMAYLTHETTLLGMDGDTVAGFIVVMQDEDYGFGGLHICNLNVAAPYRRQGLAERMIRTACRQCAPEYRDRPVTLDVAKPNLPARLLYEKLGFVYSDLPSENGPTDFVMTAPFSVLLG